MSYTVYILYSQNLDKYYTGLTENIDVRIVQHNTGMNKSTAKASDWVVVYKETFSTREEAKTREQNIKKKKSRKYIEWLISSAD